MEERRNGNRREKCQQCPLTDGVCREHNMIMTSGKWSFRILIGLIIAIFASIGSIHLQLATVRADLAVAVARQVIVLSELTDIRSKVHALEKDLRTKNTE